MTLYGYSFHDDPPAQSPLFVIPREGFPPAHFCNMPEHHRVWADSPDFHISHPADVHEFETETSLLQ